jgi:hypothetical protein
MVDEMREYNKGEENVRKSTIYLFVLGLAVVVMTAIASAGLVVSAQNTNSSTTTMTGESKPKPKTKHTKKAAATPAAAASAGADTGSMASMPMQKPAKKTGRCDPTQQEQTDLSGTYTGKATHADGSVSNDVTLTVTGNNFTMTGGPEAMSGRITAVTTCGYTAVTIMSGDMTPPAPGTMPGAAHTAVSLRAKKVGDRLTLTSVPGEPHEVSFVSAGAAAKAPRKHRAKKTGAPPPPPKQ